jgi:hypothetical protein
MHNDCLRIIFSYICWTDDILAFKLVCKQWYKAVKGMPRPSVTFKMEPYGTRTWNSTASTGRCLGPGCEITIVTHGDARKQYYIYEPLYGTEGPPEFLQVLTTGPFDKRVEWSGHFLDDSFATHTLLGRGIVERMDAQWHGMSLVYVVNDPRLCSHIEWCCHEVRTRGSREERMNKRLKLE